MGYRNKNPNTFLKALSFFSKARWSSKSISSSRHRSKYQSKSSEGRYRKVIRAVFSVAVIATLVACGGKDKKRAKSLAKLLSTGGTTYTVAKSTTKVDGFVVLQNMQTGEYIAFNAKKYDKKTMETADDYLNSLGAGDMVNDLEKYVTTRDVWETRYRTEYTQEYVEVPVYDADGIFIGYDWEWVDVEIQVPYEVLVTKTFTTYERGNYVFQHNAQMQKDLEKMGALAQTKQIENLSGVLSERFGLSTERATDVARQLNSFSEVGKSRELSDADYQALYADLLGASKDEIDQARAMAEKGNNSNLDNLIQKAADLNAISPEQVRMIMGTVDQI